MTPPGKHNLAQSLYREKGGVLFPFGSQSRAAAEFDRVLVLRVGMPSIATTLESRPVPGKASKGTEPPPVSSKREAATPSRSQRSQRGQTSLRGQASPQRVPPTSQRGQSPPGSFKQRRPSSPRRQSKAGAAAAGASQGQSTGKVDAGDVKRGSSAGTAPMQPAGTKIKRRAGISDGRDAQEGGAFVAPKHFPKTDEQRATIMLATQGSPLFAGLTEQQREEVVGAMCERKCEVGETVITQGERGDAFFVVASGAFSAYLSQVESGVKPVKNYETGGTFGELALMYNSPRAASVKCTASGALWSLDRQTFRGILMAVHMGELDTAVQFLQAVSILSPLTDEQRARIGEALTEHTFEAGEAIVREGDVADALFIIKRGEVLWHGLPPSPSPAS